MRMMYVVDNTISYMKSVYVPRHRIINYDFKTI